MSAENAAPAPASESWKIVLPCTRIEAEAKQLALLQPLGVELVILARYMQILTEGFVALYPAAIINVHHSFLPAFIGARPYHAAHARGVKLIGATSHYVTSVLDDVDQRLPAVIEDPDPVGLNDAGTGHLDEADARLSEAVKDVRFDESLRVRELVARHRGQDCEIVQVKIPA